MTEADKIYCPQCRTFLDPEADDVRTELKLTQVIIDRHGKLVINSADAFLDQWHMTCGYKVRFTHNLLWSDEVFDYLPDTDPMVEIDGPNGFDKYGDLSTMPELADLQTSYTTLSKFMLDGVALYQQDHGGI